MHLDDLHGLFVQELKDAYSAENQIFDALPGLIGAAADRGLGDTLMQHMDETRGHIERLEEIFREVGADPVGQTCKGMQGLVREAEQVVADDADDDVRDAGIIAAAQRMEHYEIAAYGTLATYAKTLGLERPLQLLLEVLEEEKAADAALTEIAKGAVSARAMR